MVRRLKKHASALQCFRFDQNDRRLDFRSAPYHTVEPREIVEPQEVVEADEKCP